ncbi:hypothetical protein GSY69_13530 [Brevibacterium sp. 5221]|uniref:Uncharacterized protein n=1 Tax=Brevibacterium rongguiense TaxID=2695267 RepID=A0A6N9HAA1_9MICO|nr:MULTISPECIES: hypothetical protein [Brevibacterium]MYM20953.1 hypothetical protein [Brevibacterium rongguiense]WAL39442.1 hypothetical protein BRM1_09135 [Brevibacterium sp. BRM-1]
MTPPSGSGFPTGPGAARLRDGARPHPGNARAGGGTADRSDAELDCSTYYEYLAAHTDSLPVVADAPPAAPTVGTPAAAPTAAGSHAAKSHVTGSPPAAGGAPRHRRALLVCIAAAVLLLVLIAVWAIGSALLEPSDGLQPAEEGPAASHAAGLRAPAQAVPGR